MKRMFKKILPSAHFDAKEWGGGGVDGSAHRYLGQGQLLMTIIAYNYFWANTRAAIISVSGLYFCFMSN